MINSKKEQSGITLIALVVTIIVLLILAGIAISMVTGDNSILQKTAEAKERTEQTSEEERMRLAVLSALTDGKGTVDLTKHTGTNAPVGLEKALAEEFGEDSAIYTTYTAGKVTLSNGDEYTVTENGDVEKAKDYETISKDTSFVGYYADVDGKDGPDGIIYADLAIGTSATRKWTME